MCKTFFRKYHFVDCSSLKQMWHLSFSYFEFNQTTKISFKTKKTLVRQPTDHQSATITILILLIELIQYSGGSRISLRRGRQLPRGGRQHTILPNFPKNCMKLKEFGPPGGGARPKFYYVDPPLQYKIGKTLSDNVDQEQGHEANDRSVPDLVCVLISPLTMIIVKPK